MLKVVATHDGTFCVFEPWQYVSLCRFLPLCMECRKLRGDPFLRMRIQAKGHLNVMRLFHMTSSVLALMLWIPWGEWQTEKHRLLYRHFP